MLIQDSDARSNCETIQLDGKTYYRIGRGRYVSSKKKRDEYFRAETKAIEKATNEMNRKYDEYLKSKGYTEDPRFQDADIAPQEPEKKGFWRRVLEIILLQW